MRKIIDYLVILVLLVPLVSCVDTEERDDTPSGNFEALWQILDERYCFFDYKQKEYGLDWNEVYNKYKVRVNDNMNTTQLFEVLCDMLAELRDGHVNLSSSMDYGRYWKWQEDYPNNFSDTLSRRYLGTDYKIASGLRYRVLDDNIGYIRCASFESPIGEGNLDEVLSYLVSKDLSAGHAKALLSVRSKERQIALARKAVKEGMSVRKLEALVQEKPKQIALVEPLNPAEEIVYKDITRTLQNALGTKVSIVRGPKKSKIEIEYYSEEELERLVELLSQR